MSHPCAGHACDHCHLCDNLGICCASAPTSTASVAMTTKPDIGSLTDLRAALAEDTNNGRTSLSDLRHLVSIAPPVSPIRTLASATRLAALHAPDDRLALPSGSGEAAVLRFVRKAGDVGMDVRHLELVPRSHQDRR